MMIRLISTTALIISAMGTLALVALSIIYG